VEQYDPITKVILFSAVLRSNLSLGISERAKSRRAKIGARLRKKLTESGVVGSPLSPSVFALVPIFARLDFARSLQRNTCYPG